MYWICCVRVSILPMGYQWGIGRSKVLACFPFPAGVRSPRMFAFRLRCIKLLLDVQGLETTELLQDPVRFRSLD